MYRNKVLKNFKCAQLFCLIITVVNGISKKNNNIKSFFSHFSAFKVTCVFYKDCVTFNVSNVCGLWFHLFSLFIIAFAQNGLGFFFLLCK